MVNKPFNMQRGVWHEAGFRRNRCDARAGLAGGADDLVEVFLGSSGASLDDLRARAAEPEFLASVLDFILMDDAWVLECADALGCPADRWRRCARRCPAAGCRTGRDGSAGDGGSARFAGIQRRQQALELQRLFRAELGVEMIHVLDGRADAPPQGASTLPRSATRWWCAGPRAPSRAIRPSSSSCRSAREVAVRSMPTNCRDFGGVFQPLFLDGQKDAPAHTRQAIVAQTTFHPALDGSRGAGDLKAQTCVKAEFCTHAVHVPGVYAP
jgi:hypothetical protein